SFEISPDDWIKAESLGKITAIVHSHPHGLPILSEADQIMQQQSGVDWWLVCDGNVFKFRYLTPLLGRQFLHGVMDCYTLFRDAYHLCGYALPDFHRPNLWWEKGENLYVDNMTEHGFYRVDEPQEGDVV